MGIQWMKDREKTIKGTKPNYLEIMSQSSKEVVAVVKKLIALEKLKVTECMIFGGSRVLDIVLISERRLFIVRHIKGTKQAHYHEFRKAKWSQYTNPDKPNVSEFLAAYDEGMQSLDDHWKVR